MFEFLSELFNDYRPKPTKETIVVAKPYCTPARDIVTAICDQYGVKLLGFSEKVNYLDWITVLHSTNITVSSKQAEWAEYLLLRSKRFMLMSKPKNKRNFEWATKHKQMPDSWNGKPLIEVGCKEGFSSNKESKKRKA
jgi:hypothetical protein